jgi:hypothetical protein
LISARVNILKTNCANSKKIAVVVYSVEAMIEEFDVRKQYAGTTTLTSPQNTKNFVDVVPIKKTQVEKVARTIPTIDTVTLKTETTNKFKNQNSLRSAPTTDFSKNVDVETDARARVERAAKTSLHSPEVPQTRDPQDQDPQRVREQRCQDQR